MSAAVLKNLVLVAGQPTVLIAGSGYLVDMYDLFSFNILRLKSLKDLGLSVEAVTSVGVNIINMQLIGLIVGAVIWGKLGDRIGRKKVLLTSILLYSIASLLTAAVTDQWQYGALRLIAGIGLAGELGAGITIISEEFSGEQRGLAVGVFIILGFVGILLAAALATSMDWRPCYFIGGVFGLLLLLLRYRLQESKIYLQNKNMAGIKYGGLLALVANKLLRKQFFAGILLLLPTVFIPQIVWSLSPEIALAKGIADIAPAVILGAGYSLVIGGDLLAIYLAEKFGSRKRCLGIFSALGALVFVGFLFYPSQNQLTYYFWSSALGLAFGTWVVGSTMIAEMFGSNFRATAATTIPNFCRGSVILMNLLLLSIKPSIGIVNAVATIGALVFSLAFVGIFLAEETYGKDLQFVDH